MKIGTSLPKNIDVNSITIFHKRKFYKKHDVKVLKRKHVFISHYGIALKCFLFVSKTLPNKWGYKKPNGMFGFGFYKKVLEEYFVSKFGKSLSQITLCKNKKYLFVFSPWFGYFSWITESLPRILMVKEQLADLILILPESYSKKKFVIESLSMFPQLKSQIIPNGVHMMVPKVVIPQLKPWTYEFDPIQMQQFRKFVISFVEKLNLKMTTPKKIYVSRKKAKNRKLQNETQVLNELELSGFVELEFENYSFFEQVHLMNNCDLLCGVHGAAFANVCFLKEKSVLFEFIKEYSSYKEERPSYWRLCSALNIDYYIQYCKPIKYGKYDTWVGIDLIADIAELKNNLAIIG
ncbi:MAG: glycosyltransferase family 61 protein [Salinivirgaceae bacterium]|nr:glycosyltransferase family 61 protein [Salinivirgaceae bacterium]